MKKYLSIILAIIMILSLCACGKQVDPENLPEDPATEEENALGDDIWSFMINSFELRNSEALKALYDDQKPDDSKAFYPLLCWNDDDEQNSTAPKIFINQIEYNGATVYVGLLANETNTRIAPYWISVANGSSDDFVKFLRDTDFHATTNKDALTGELITEYPYGYISTWDSIILVDGGSNTREMVTTINDDTVLFEMTNLESMAYVLGIDIQDSIEEIESMDDAYNMQSYLDMASYFGVRGYDSYLNSNGFGVVIKTYKDLVKAVDDAWNDEGVLSDILMYVNGSDAEGLDGEMDYFYGSDPTEYDNWVEPDYEDDYSYEDSTTTKTYPPIVNKYIDYGYAVYEYNFAGAVAYYYQENATSYIRFASGNGDIVSNAWSDSVAPYSFNNAFMLTRIS